MAPLLGHLLLLQRTGAGLPAPMLGDSLALRRSDPLFLFLWTLPLTHTHAQIKIKFKLSVSVTVGSEVSC